MKKYTRLVSLLLVVLIIVSTSACADSKKTQVALKEEVETLNKKLAEPTDEELAQVAGGAMPAVIRDERVYDLPGLEATATDDHPLWVC